ncbi:MAG: hypothetical protein ACM3N0_02130 [Chloroflexota bacterium]
MTYANVMSSIAVFLVLGGAAFAAANLPKNSVGTKQLKNNAVTKKKIKKNSVVTNKIKNNAVTGAKVKESTLSTVPSAASLTPPEATHLVGAPGEPPFEGGSSNLPSGTPLFSFNPVGFFKDHEGIVHLQGIAKAGGEGIVFTLPPGYRPASGKLLFLTPYEETSVLIVGSNVSEGTIDLSGKVLGSSGEPVVLDNISYRAES